MARENSINRFNNDIQTNAGYLYTSTDRLSCRFSNQRLSLAARQMTDFRGKAVVDVGCGDGTYSFELLDAGAASVVGVDAADEAVALANRRAEGDDRIRFEASDIYTYRSPAQRYQLAVVRGLLHHLYEPEKAIANISHLAEEIIVVEPNGYNPLLKIIEKLSRYHVEHEEKSFTPHQLRRWFERHGGTVISGRYVGLVPFFCPDLPARILKAIEPLVERIPLLRHLCCGVYVFRVKMARP